MYSLDIARLRQLRRAGWEGVDGVGPNVWFLGLTSLLTDVSSEMVASVLPLYLVVAIGLTPLQFGLVDGLSQAAAVASGWLGGWLADGRRRYHALAAGGYALSAACRLLLAVAGAATGPVFAGIALDRIGKGLRTAPRDAMIARSAAPARLGLAFGIHRALDTVGALVGPLAASTLLWHLPQAFDLVFGSAFFVALAGVATLLCFVRDGPPGPRGGAPARVRPAAGGPSAWRDPRVRGLVASATLLGVFTMPDAFVLLLIQRELAAPAAAFALYPVVAALAMLALAVPAGRLADRFGRAKVFLAGHGLLVVAGVALLAGGAHPVVAAAVLVLGGAHAACTDGVVAALSAPVAAPGGLGAMLGTVGAAGATSRLAGAIAFGALWTAAGPRCAVGVFAAGLAGAVVVCAWMLGRRGGGS
jgi:MFS family permease